MRTTLSSTAAPVAAALAVGIMTATQSKVVGDFEEFTRNNPEFVLLNYLAGIVVLSVIVLATPRIRTAVASIPSLLRSRRLRWYQCLGGVFGSWLVVSAALTVPKLGLSLAVVALICGLIVAGVVVDAFGLGPAGKNPPTRNRILGAAIALVAVGVEVAPSIASEGLGADTPLFTLLAFSAGCGVAVQQAFNGHVASASGQPLAAGWINFVAGIGALSLVVAVTAATGVTPLEPATDMPLWALAPGLLGAAFVTLGAWAVGGIGVLLLGLLSVTGQIFTALIFDLLNPKVGILMDARTGIAALLALAAAFVSSRRRVSGDAHTH
ncbi:MAG: DMT family transporter [Candidatus Nanopelagicales bacterium]